MFPIKMWYKILWKHKILIEQFMETYFFRIFIFVLWEHKSFDQQNMET